ncbi:sulfur carrier protein ThiS [Actinokineospora fastidiosa]|uniref:Thiamine biosynthesis protein ThiS n=1 Tax=Actinokineospora fastidiosa TaxID=1816 RepID=A0A918L7I8_9PSEU|nr:sulfur carrier protein ThiS [Actinokineospora fastidiosa]GGS16042.1 thiamine biosynthesis protein ThiS [Actinokineospora fastidiosa]
MRIVVNGVPREVADGATVAEVLAALGLPSAGIAVAVDGAVVPRASHAVTVVAPEASLEVLTAVQGG